MFMDLSRAFDTLNHELPLAKVVDGFSENAMPILKVTCLIDIKEPA